MLDKVYDVNSNHDVKYQGTLPIGVNISQILQEAKSEEKINLIEQKIVRKVSAYNQNEEKKYFVIKEDIKDQESENIIGTKQQPGEIIKKENISKEKNINKDLESQEQNKIQDSSVLEEKASEQHEETNNKPGKNQKTDKNAVSIDAVKPLKSIDPSSTKNFLNFLKEERNTFSKNFTPLISNNSNSKKKENSKTEQKKEKIQKQSSSNINKSESLVSCSGDIDVPEELEPIQPNKKNIVNNIETKQLIKSIIKVPLFPEIARNRLKEELKQFPLVTIFEAKEIDLKDGSETVIVVRNIAHHRKSNPYLSKTPLTSRKYLKK